MGESTRNVGELAAKQFAPFGCFIIRYRFAVGVGAVDDGRFVCSCKGNDFSDAILCYNIQKSVK